MGSLYSPLVPIAPISRSLLLWHRTNRRTSQYPHLVQKATSILVLIVAPLLLAPASYGQAHTKADLIFAEFESGHPAVWMAQVIPPINSIVTFQTPTAWASYKWYVLIALATFLVQAFLILKLLVSSRQRRQTELESQRLAALAEAEHKRLGEVVSSVPGVVWETRIDPATGQLKLTFLSDHAEKMFGYTVSEWLSTPSIALNFVHELDRESVVAEFQAILLQANQKALRFRCLTRDGRTIWVEAHLAPVFDDDGNVIGVRGVTLDLTEQQLTEDARRQSEERNRALLQAVPDPMFLLTRDGVYLDYHAKDPKTLIVPPGLFLGKNVRTVLPPELAEEFLQRFERAEPGEPQIMEYDLEVNGAHSWFEARIVRTGDNILSVVRDVSARKLSEIALTQNELQLSGIIGSAMDAIITVDENHEVVVFNAAAERLFLCSAAEALGQSLDRFIPTRVGNSEDQHVRLFGDTNDRGLGLPEEFYGLRTSGEEFPVEASISQTKLSGQKFRTIILRDITERKRTLDELRLGEERFAKAFNANPQPMSLTTMAEGLYLDVNDSFLQMSGYTREEVIGHTSLELNIWETPQARRDFVHQLKEQGSIVNKESKFRTKAGPLRVLLSSAEQLEIAGQECLLVASSDITERVEAQQAMRESEARFRILADSSPVLIWTNGLEGCEFVNRSYLEFVGRSMDEVLGMKWSSAVHPDDVESYVNGYLEAFQNRVPYEEQFRFRRSDGEYRWFKSIGTPRFTPDGTFLGYVGSSVDVSDLKNSEAALRESEARFRNMADTAPVMIWMADDDKAYTYFNKQWLDFTGHGMDEEIGDGWLKGIHHEDYLYRLELYAVKFNERERFEMEYRLRRHDGQYRWVLDSGTPRFSADGAFLGYIGSCLDITERKEAEVVLQKAHKELNQLKNQLEAENIYLQEELLLDRTFGEIVGQSDAIKYVLFAVTQVAPTDSTVLVTGETGTGKELVARAIHSESLRKDRPFIKVNCGALSPTLIESELFGHERGAFTGASGRKLGRFELANGGTIFLDEIGELPPELQVKLLRVIQESEFERLGSSKTMKVDVRVIAATNRNLKHEVEVGTFREDLWYRLNVYPITVPPLRQRKEDIPLLVEHFVRRYAKKAGKSISEVSLLTMQMLQTHSWPGNIRELANVIERAVIHTSGNVLETLDRFEPPVEEERASLQTLQELEHDYIVRTLENTGWRIEGRYGAAKILGLNPSTLRTRLQKLGIQRRGTNYVDKPPPKHSKSNSSLLPH